jgi:hypothetical protein
MRFLRDFMVRIGIAAFGLLTMAAATGSQAQIAACVVQDPEPPLNVRSEPEGDVVGRLDNATSVLQLGASAYDSRWVQIAARLDVADVGGTVTSGFEFVADIGVGAYQRDRRLVECHALGFVVG